MKIGEVLQKLEMLGNSKSKEGMSRFGINTEKAFGISIVNLRKLAREIGTDHKLALELWQTGFHEARILATMIDDPKKVTSSQMDKWVKDFNSWDLCDQCCNNLFVYSVNIYDKATKWSLSKSEYIKRAGFVLMAVSAVHRKEWRDPDFQPFFSRIIEEADDERNFVKKAVNWALRQIGKRNTALNKKAIAVAEDLMRRDSISAKWIAKDAIRELTSEKVQKKISKSAA